jgi:deazaflavin-dependent oxidoreductase (nitroreductase family)
MGGVLNDELRATIECRLTTTGRSSGEPREIRIWFAADGDRLVLLAQDRDRAHWVRNVLGNPGVRVQIGRRRFEGRARVIDPAEADDAAARERFAAKYGTKYLAKFLREALPVAIDLDREVERP